MPTSRPRATTILVVCLALFACSKDSARQDLSQDAGGEAPSAMTAGSPRVAALGEPIELPPLCKGCNVVLVSMDTVRADHLGCYGYERDTSPNVDDLAARSVLFEHAISQAAWTLPAHGSIMTGLYPGRLGVTHYPALRRLPVGVDTLAEQFKKAGYQTAAFTGGGFVAGHFGFDRGFDIYASDGRRFEHNMDEALPWLDQNAGRPFFLFLHGYNAHRPYFSGAEDKKAMGLPDRSPVERRGFCTRDKREKPAPKQLETIVRFYDAAIHHGDREVGRFIDALEAHGLLGKTVVLITSDHGEEFFEHGNCDHVRFVYREVVGVPYVLYVPRLSPAGRRVKQVVPASISVAGTLLDVVGLEHHMPGVSLEPILRGESGLFDAVYSEASSAAGKLGSRGPTLGVTTDTEKLISYTQEGTEEAYDIVQDPWEQQVLPTGHEAYAMRNTLMAWKRAMVALPRVLPGATAVVRAPASGKASDADDSASAGVQAASKPRTAGGVSAAGHGTATTTVGPTTATTQPDTEADPTAAKGQRSPSAATKPDGERARATSPAGDEPEGEKIPDAIREQLESLGYLE